MSSRKDKRDQTGPSEDKSIKLALLKFPMYFNALALALQQPGEDKTDLIYRISLFFKFHLQK